MELIKEILKKLSKEDRDGLVKFIQGVTEDEWEHPRYSGADYGVDFSFNGADYRVYNGCVCTEDRTNCNTFKTEAEAELMLKKTQAMFKAHSVMKWLNGDWVRGDKLYGYGLSVCVGDNPCAETNHGYYFKNMQAHQKFIEIMGDDIKYLFYCEVE
tara:strand:- start:13703 stop:14170 length:468 start_codon:yes stop_codon:yes gene_type:complete